MNKLKWKLLGIFAGTLLLMPGLAMAVDFQSTASELNAKNCQETSSSNCFKVVRCEIPGGRLDGYTDANTKATFALTASAHHFVSPKALLGEYAAEFETVRAAKKSANTSLGEKIPNQKRRQNFSGAHFSATMSRNARMANTKVVFPESIPACVKPGDIQ